MEYFALQCASCNVFVNQQKTKNSKWVCRGCGAKQSIVRIFARSGNAAAVRGAVSELNMRRGAQENLRMEQRLHSAIQQADAPQDDYDDDDDEEIAAALHGGAMPASSRGLSGGGAAAAPARAPAEAVSSVWSEFLPPPSDGSGAAAAARNDDDEWFVTAVPQDVLDARKRKRGREGPGGSQSAGQARGGGGSKWGKAESGGRFAAKTAASSIPAAAANVAAPAALQQTGRPGSSAVSSIRGNTAVIGGATAGGSTDTAVAQDGRHYTSRNTTKASDAACDTGGGPAAPPRSAPHAAPPQAPTIWDEYL